jgi:hypothetical protein
MKRDVISFACVFSLILTTSLYSQTIYVSGVINSNTEWEADTVKVVGDLTVTQGVLLTVNPGTYIEFQGHFELNIAGSFQAIGTPSDTIEFTSNDTIGFWADTLSVAGGWAGIKFQNSSTVPDSAVFEYCRIQYAKKYDDYGGDINGGAIMADDYGTLRIKNCILNYNMVICYTNGINGPAGGAVFCKKVANVVIESNSFTGNRSFDNGGAIHIDPDCQVLIANNRFIDNKAYWWKDLPPPWGWVESGTGGAIGTTDDLGFSPTICNNYCFNNKTINGVIYTSNRHGLIFNNVICNNYGMGIMDGHQLSETRIFNNTIINNTTSFGGILLVSKAILYNNICWGNESFPGQQLDQINVSDAHAGYQLFYNCVEYGEGGSNSIYDYPEFVDPTEGVGLDYDGSIADWSLQDVSPCINHGTPDTNGLFIPDSDIEGNLRIYGASIEMGAYENQNVIIQINEPEITQNKISVYPNPGTSVINVILEKPGTIFQLFSSTGSLLVQEQLHNGVNEANVQSLRPGMYFYQVISSNKEIINSGKWMKIANRE